MQIRAVIMMLFLLPGFFFPLFSFAQQAAPACLTGENIGLECATDADCGAGGLCCTAGSDNDSDDIPDICDFCAGKGQYDLDEDGICDAEDNCPTVPNPRQNKDVCAYAVNELQENTLIAEKYMPIAVFKGSWYDMGRQAGMKYAHQIISFGQLFGWAVNTFKPVNAWSAQQLYAEIQDLLPQSYKDHLDGLADGLVESLHLAPEEARSVVLMLNIGTEILNMKNMASIPEPLQHEVLSCTGFAVTSAAGAFLCHNTDAQSDASGSAISYWQPEAGYTYLTVDPPGWADVGFGLNEKGVAVTTNAGNPNDNATFGMPPNIMLRRVMEEADTLEAAVALFENCAESGTFGTGGALIHVVDFNQKKIAKLQIRSKNIQVTFGQLNAANGTTYVGSANHYTPEFYLPADYSYASSFARYERLMDLLETTQAEFTLQQCWSVLQDTGNGEATNNTISRIAPKNSGLSRTVFSTIFTPEGMYYATMAPHQYFEQYDSAQFVGTPDNPQVTLIDELTVKPLGVFRLLQWHTFSQKRPARFNIYRSSFRDGGYRKINLLPIRAAGNTGRSYGFLDLTALGRDFYYRVETVDAGGISIMKGPVQAGRSPDTY